MSGSAACTQLNVPVRFTASVRDQSSSVMSAKRTNPEIAALVTRISTGPRASRTSPSARSTDDRSATSTVPCAMAAPSARIASAAAAAASPSTSSTATRLPARASASPTARPIPDPPPVSTATRPTASPLSSLLYDRTAMPYDRTRRVRGGCVSQTDLEYDPYDREIDADPYPTYQRLRDEA